MHVPHIVHTKWGDALVYPPLQSTDLDKLLLCLRHARGQGLARTFPRKGFVYEGGLISWPTPTDRKCDF